MAGIDRRKVNKQSVSASDPARSGFDLSYSSYSDYVLGLAHVSGVQWQMPGSKFGGQNVGDFTFNNVSTPMVTPIDATQFNVVVSLRSIDNSFEDAFAPSKNNNMSASWHVPTWTLGGVAHDIMVNLGVVDGVLNQWVSQYKFIFDTDIDDNLTAAQLTSISNIKSDIEQLLTVTGISDFTDHYLTDFLVDWNQYFQSRVQGFTTSNTIAELRYAFLDAIFTPLLGEGSLIDELGYNKLRRYDIYNMANYAFQFATPNDFFVLFDTMPQSEYALRAYYAAWYELLREPNLEPVSTTLPKWKHFGSSPICSLPFFAHRYRAWYDDPYTTSQPDDMSRHVYAPIFNSNDVGTVDNDQPATVYYPTDNDDYEYAEGNPMGYINQRSLVSQKLTWRDSVTGQDRFLMCPLPGLVHDSLRSASSGENVYGLDLMNLRQAQSLERYLKRNFYFGDEYKDRMLAHYGSEVSDNRLNRPTLLSTSINAKAENQEIANVATELTNVGDRTATMTVQTGGDGYQYFAEEFCIVLNLIAFMPRPQYGGMLAHNLLYREMDFPVPEFAANNEELSRVAEIACAGYHLNGADTNKTFGHHPYAHIWRGRVDEVHGTFLSNRRDYSFARFFGADEPDTTPKLNYLFIHCRPTLGMFLNQIRLDGQLYGRVHHEFYSECPLPVPVENI